MTIIQSKLKLILKDIFNNNYSAMARSAGLSDTAIRKYIIKGAPPNYRLLSSLIMNNKVDGNWLLNDDDTTTPQLLN